MPIAPAAFQWALDIAPVGSPLALDVPGDVQWTTAPVGRVAVNPCTGARTVITRSGGAVPPADIPVTIRVDPRDDQAAIRDALRAAWAAGTTGTLTPPLTSLLPARTVVLDPSQAFQEVQRGGVLFVTVTLLGVS